MAIQLTAEKAKEIAEELDCGLNCFYNIKDHSIESLPPEYEDEYGADEVWKPIADKIDAAWEDYVKFEPMDSNEGYRTMQRFADEVARDKVQMALIKALQMRKPFQQFKNVVYGDDELRDQWYAFKRACDIEYVLLMARMHGEGEIEDDVNEDNAEEDDVE